jgi:hypothetical protein
VLLAAPPRWFADNIVQISLVALVVLTVLVLRMVQKTAMRITLLVLIAAVALFVYVNREPLKACAETCECEIADRNLDVPFCDPDLDLSSRP